MKDNWNPQQTVSPGDLIDPFATCVIYHHVNQL